MIESAAGELQARENIFRFQIWQFFKDLLLRETGGQQIEYIDDSNSHPPDARPSTTLSRVYCNPFNELGHDGCFPNRHIAWDQC